MKWDGEWHITYEVFRDLGLAFAAVLVLIYILVVAWFQSFKTPLVIMAAIPFSLVGILPAHALMGAFFTATSMIGFIAGAGIVVRNSIILVDFIELQAQAGDAAGRCRGRCRGGAFPPHDADGSRGRRRIVGDSLRPHLSGSGHLADGRGSRFSLSFADDGSDPFLLERTEEEVIAVWIWRRKKYAYSKEIKELESEIEEIEKSIPPHSVRYEMIQLLEEKEGELKRKKDLLRSINDVKRG